MTGSHNRGLMNDGNGLPRLFRMSIPMGDTMSTTEKPHPASLADLFDQLGLTNLHLVAETLLAQARLFAAQNHELVALLLDTLVDARQPEADPPSDDQRGPDFGISLEQEFIIRNDKGETEAILYFEEVSTESDAESDAAPVMWIESFSVMRPLRRKGVGKALMRAFLQRYGEQVAIFLRVRPYNDAPMNREQLVAFYHKWGFIELVVPTVMVRYPHPPRYKREDV